MRTNPSYSSGSQSRIRSLTRLSRAHPTQSAVAPIRNGCRLLDICTGLGYTACGAADLGAVVTTVELDDAMQARGVASILADRAQGSYLVVVFRCDLAAVFAASRSANRAVRLPPRPVLPLSPSTIGDVRCEPLVAVVQPARPGAAGQN